MTLNPAVLAASTLLALGGAIAFSYQPPIELKSNPYTSIQEAVQPSAHPLFKGLGMMMIGGAVIGGLYAYQPNKRQVKIDESVNKPSQQEEKPWQISEPEKEEDALTDITERSFSISNNPSPPTDGFRQQRTFPTPPKPIDLWSDEEDEPIPPPPLPAETRSGGLVKVGGVGFDEEPEPFSEIEKIFHYGSAIIAGASGSGKSSALRHLIRKRLEARPDTRLLIIDPHYDPDESSWLPGYSREEQDRIIVRDPFRKGLSAFTKVYEEGLRREELILKKEPPILVVIDEYQGFITRSNSGKEMGEMLVYSQNAFRKFNIDIFVGLHSLKKSECGIDSSATMQMHWYLLGNLINDTNTIIPDHWDRKRLHRERISTGDFAAIICRKGGDPFVTATPDLSYQAPLEPQEKSNVVEFKKKGA